MLVEENEYLGEAAKAIFEANADWLVREHCIARELAERRERTLERDIRLLKGENISLKGEVSDLKEQIKDLEARLSEKE